MELRSISAMMKIGIIAGFVGAIFSLDAEPVVAGGFGKVLSKAGDDVIEAFNGAANPKVTPKILKPELKYNPPELVPGGATTWSNGANGTVSPNLTKKGLAESFNGAASQ